MYNKNHVPRSNLSEASHVVFTYIPIAEELDYSTGCQIVHRISQVQQLTWVVTLHPLLLPKYQKIPARMTLN